MVNFEHDKPVFLLWRDAKAPKAYNHLAILREQFSPEGPVPAKELTPAPQEGQESPVVPAEEPAKLRKDMTKANEARREKIEARWKDQFPIGVALTLFCLQQYGKTGKPVTQKEYEAALRQQGYDSLMIEAGEVFRKLMPPEILHRGD